MFLPSQKKLCYAYKKEIKNKSLCMCLYMILSLIVFVGITIVLESSLNNLFRFCLIEFLIILVGYAFYKVIKFTY
jgi:hypothetical protein